MKEMGMRVFLLTVFLILFAPSVLALPQVVQSALPDQILTFAVDPDHGVTAGHIPKLQFGGREVEAVVSLSLVKRF